ncbi:MAG: hypothetical protein ABIV21_00720 [Pyrinomonadaceae bacterium]
MKRFMFSILVVTVFFLGVGAVIEKTGARFKSDEKALDLVRKARVALGGDSALAAVQSLRIVGQTTNSVKIEGLDRSRQGETEIALQMPDKLMKMVKIGADDGTGESKQMVDRQVNVVVVGGDGDGGKAVTVDGGGPEVRTIVIKKPDGTTQEFTGAEADKVVLRDSKEKVSSDGTPAQVRKIVIKGEDGTVKEYTGAEADKIIAADKAGSNAVWTTEGKANGGERHMIMRHGGDHEGMKQIEMLRLTLGLLLTAPQGIDVSYTFGGESTIDGTACNIVNADALGSTFKIYLGQTSNLPVMMTYTGHQMPRMIKFKRTDAPPADGKEAMTFERKIVGPAFPTAEFNVKFSDYRSVAGVQFPYKWVQTVGGVADESFDITLYEVNPANIAEKFRHERVTVRTAKPAEAQ